MNPSLPSWRISTLLACALSLSVGWGIRGNFGHEYGDYFAGHAGNQKRFGPEADWRIRPMLKHEEHR